jgi:hypothetical protein
MALCHGLRYAAPPASRTVNAIPFDTHRVVKRLKEAGFSEPQAETVTDVLREARDTELSALASKSDLSAATAALAADIAAVKAELKADIAALKAELKADNELLRSDMNGAIARGQAETLKWMIGLLLVQGGLIVGLLRLLPGH